MEQANKIKQAKQILSRKKAMEKWKLIKLPSSFPFAAPAIIGNLVFLVRPACMLSSTPHSIFTSFQIIRFIFLSLIIDDTCIYLALNVNHGVVEKRCANVNTK